MVFAYLSQIRRFMSVSILNPHLQNGASAIHYVSRSTLLDEDVRAAVAVGQSVASLDRVSAALLEDKEIACEVTMVAFSACKRGVHVR